MWRGHRKGNEETKGGGTWAYGSRSAEKKRLASIGVIVDTNDLGSFFGLICEPVWPVRYFIEGPWLGEIAGRVVVLIRKEVNCSISGV